MDNESLLHSKACSLQQADKSYVAGILSIRQTGCTWDPSTPGAAPAVHMLLSNIAGGAERGCGEGAGVVQERHGGRSAWARIRRGRRTG